MTREQRRLAAILSADVAGYSRLMETDEAGTVAAFRRHRDDLLDPKIRQYGGRIVNTAGDSLLVEFTSAIDAVQCAVEIQRAMAERNAAQPAERRMELRVGINLGDVIVEGEDIHGDGVNVAARLERLAEPGGVCISGTVHENIVGRLPFAFDDTGEQSVKNISRPVRVFRLLGGKSGTSDAGGPESGDGTQSYKPTIAVLPFLNMSGDPEQEYFSDGITEDIITELSRFKNLFVIARNSTFHYKGRAPKVLDVARELGVAYVVEGSVRKAANRVRITAQLIDAGTGAHIWADRYDRELADVFAVQDEITQNVVGVLAVSLEDDTLERARRRPPENVRAYEHWLRGKRFLWTAGAPNLEARRHFEHAVAVDPNFSWAHAGLSLTYQMEAQDYPSEQDFWRAQDMALHHAQKALALDEATYQAHVGIAWTYLYRRDYDRSRRHLERAIALNPNDADTLANGAYIFSMYGQPSEAVKCGETALRLNPRQPDWYLGYNAAALFAARRYDEAIVVRLRAPDLWVDSPFHTAAILAYLGRMDEAAVWGARGVRRLLASPGGSRVGAKTCIQVLLDNNPYRRPEDQDHFAEGMRKAGVPG